MARRPSRSWRTRSASCHSRIEVAGMENASQTATAELSRARRSAVRPVLIADAWFGRVLEWIAAALVLVEIAILFAGVVARYGLRAPLVWTDELASILFLWLAMIGAVVAFRRAEHMRMTALVSRAGERPQQFLEGLALAAALALLLALLRPAYEHAADE